MLSGLLFISPLLLAWLGCFWVARELAARRLVDGDWRLSWLFASIGFGFLLTLIVELSSLIQSLNGPALALAWLIADCLLLWTGFRLGKRRRNLLPICGQENGEPTCRAQIGGQQFLVSPKSMLSFHWTALRVWPAEARGVLAITALLTIFLFFIGLLTPTTNIDSFGYHLARMAHWIQQGNVNHYPTDDLRQLEFGPWSSFLMMNLFLLWGNDQLVNLVQWFAMLSSVILLSWIVEQLASFSQRKCGQSTIGDRRPQTVAFTCLFAVTLPIGLVESISTQNDYTTAFWVLCFFAIGFLLHRSPANPWYVAAAGLSCGLGVLTKATTYIYCAPLVLAGGVWWLCRVSSLAKRDFNAQPPANPGKRRWLPLRLSFLFVGLFFILNSSHMSRNFVLFGSPLGSSGMLSSERNGRISTSVAASNLIRNLALHANTGVPWLTHIANTAVGLLHRLTREELNDPATTFPLCRFEFRQRFSMSDSVASCSVHLALALGTGFLAILRWRQNMKLLGYAALVVLSVALFCALLKWQLWHTRIHLAWFLLLAPVIALVLSAQSNPWGTKFASAVLLLSAAITLVHNSSRPVLSTKFWSLPREKQYFTPPGGEGMRDSLAELAERISSSKCQNVGLKAGFCGIEYPLWIMLRNRGFNGRIDRCFVENTSVRIPSSAPQPDVIISVFNLIPPGLTNDYPHVENFSGLTVLWAKKNKIDPDQHRDALAGNGKSSD